MRYVTRYYWPPAANATQYVDIAPGAGVALLRGIGKRLLKRLRLPT